MLNFSSWFGHKQAPPLPQSVSPPPASPPPPRPSDKPKRSLDGSAAPTLVSPTAEHSLSAHRERRSSAHTRAASQPPPPPPSRAPPPKDEPEKDAPPRTQWSTPLQTEHDEVLAKLLGENTPPGIAKGKEKEKEKNAAEADMDKLRSRETVQTSASGAGGVPSLKVDPVYDPFTGSTLGYASRHAVPPGVDAREALWDQMAAVRALQSEIAGMHLTMENVGMGSADMGAGRGAAGMGKRRGSAGAGAEKLDELGEDGADAKDEEKVRRERDRLFERAEQTFEGRKEDIDAIMGKLDDLSDALTKLHMLDMPQLDLNADFSGPERGNTDSTFGVPSPPNPRPQHPGVKHLSRLPSHGSMFGAADRPSRMGSEGYVLESPTSMMSTLPDPIEKGPNEG